MRFIEYLWKQLKFSDYPTVSFINRTIMLELANIIELILYDILSSLKASGRGIRDKPVIFDSVLTLVSRS